MYRVWLIKISVFMFVSWSCVGSTFAQYNDKEFGEIVQSALREGGALSHYEITQIEDFKSIVEVRAPETNVRVVKVVGYYHSGSRKRVNTLTVPVIIAHVKSQIVSVAKLVDIEEDVFEDVLQKKYNQKALEVYRNEYRDVAFQLKNVNGMVEYHGVYEIGSKSKKDAGKAVAGMIRSARGFIHNLITARNDVEKERFEKLSDAKMDGPISARDFERLVEDKSLRDYRTRGDGYDMWSFGKDEFGLWFDMENHADKLVVYISRSISDLDADKKEEGLRKLIQFVKEKPFKAASNTEALYYDDAKEWLSVKMTFLYDSTLKGKKLSEAYWDLWKDYSKKIASALE